MRKENILVIVLVCMATAGIMAYQGGGLSPVTESNAMVTGVKSIAWQAFDKGMDEGRNTGKPVFLYFYADWCTYCKKLKKTTFKDKKVLAYLSENFVSISVDSDQNKELTKEWNVRGLPTLWFLDKDGAKISSIPGYIDPDQFLKVLKYVKTRSYETQSFSEFTDAL